MANQSLAGTPLPRNSAPLVTRGVPNARGLYPWSAFTADLRLISSPGVVGNTTLTTAAPTVQFLLFLSDYPLIVEVVQRKNNPATNAFLGTTPTPPIPYAVKAIGTAAFAHLYTEIGGTTLVSFAPGEVGIGYVGSTEGVVPCSGFAVSAACSAFNMLDTSGGNPLIRDVWVNVIANGAVVNGPGIFNGVSTDSDFTPIILRFSDYTQEIRDAGNVIVANDGTTYSVVGLYHVGT